MFKPTNPNNFRKTNAVLRELKNTFNRRKNNLQRGEQTYEAIGKNTRRNASANKLYMNALRRGSNTPMSSTVFKPTQYAPSLTPYIKVSGLPSGIKGLSCNAGFDGKYICSPISVGGNALRRTRKRSSRS